MEIPFPISVNIIIELIHTDRSGISMRVTIENTEKDGNISLQESGGFAIVTINRPELKNA